MQKPNEGARKAAEEVANSVIETIRQLQGTDLSDMVDLKELTEKYALIIDRETGWILCSDRMPTEEDGDEKGQVLAYNHVGAMKVVIPWNSIMAKETLWQSLPTPPEES